MSATFVWGTTLFLTFFGTLMAPGTWQQRAMCLFAQVGLVGTGTLLLRWGRCENVAMQQQKPLWHALGQALQTAGVVVAYTMSPVCLLLVGALVLLSWVVSVPRDTAPTLETMLAVWLWAAGCVLVGGAAVAGLTTDVVLMSQAFGVGAVGLVSLRWAAFAQHTSWGRADVRRWVWIGLVAGAIYVGFVALVMHRSLFNLSGDLNPPVAWPLAAWLGGMLVCAWRCRGWLRAPDALATTGTRPLRTWLVGAQLCLTAVVVVVYAAKEAALWFTLAALPFFLAVLAVQKALE